VIRRISFAVLALAALATTACSNPTAPAAKPTQPAAKVTGDLILPPPSIVVQGSGV
jgi:hypothetical protein